MLNTEQRMHSLSRLHLRIYWAVCLKTFPEKRIAELLDQKSSYERHLHSVKLVRYPAWTSPVFPQAVEDALEDELREEENHG